MTKRLHFKGIAAVGPEPVHDIHGLLVWGGSAAGSFPCQVPEGCLKVGRKARIGTAYAFIGIRVGRRGQNAVHKSGISGCHERCGDGPHIAVFQVSRGKDFTAYIEVGNQIAAGAEIPHALRGEHA